MGPILFVGCGQDKDKEIGAKKKPLITFWHWWTDRQSILEEFADQYEEETGVKVKFVLSSPSGDLYKNKLQAAALSSTLPDIIGVWGGGEFLARYINAGHISNLTDEMEEGWKDRFFPEAIKRGSYQDGNQWGVIPGTYAVPLTVMNIQIFYNKRLFEKAGLDPMNPPATWEEFIAAGRKLRAKGIAPFTAGFGDLGLAEWFLNSYAWSFLGEDNVRATWVGERSYVSPEWEAAFDKFVEMRDNEMFIEGIAIMSNKQSEQAFANGLAAMAMNGSWAVNVYYQMNPDLEYDVMSFPQDTEAANPVLLFGGTGICAAVNGKSSQKLEAIKFLKWFTDKERQIEYVEKAHTLSANRNVIDGLSPVLAKFAKGMERIIPDLEVEEKNEVREVLRKGIQSIIIGEKTSIKVLEEAQRLKDKLE
ncbi:MAG: extracellular solute-binding protein [Candidatus Omnitrophica bacterium]|nr:extracellular solute-binding protein [Candidatus Omnitrophota bacterium]